jgi:predicted NUDIX family NTP pyrophosphohydrolase
MAEVVSAGVLLYRWHAGVLQVFLVHPGGPYWSGKDAGAWSVPKGIVGEAEDELAAARREFAEETGFVLRAEAVPHDLGSFRQPSGKRLHVWAAAGDADPRTLRSNSFELEWPPHSGRRASFPEVDRGAWFEQATALGKILKGQVPVLEKFYATFARGPS